MNILAIDIGNTNINLALFLEGKEENVGTIACSAESELAKTIEAAWGKVPVLQSSKEKMHDGVIVAASVNPAATELVKRIVKETVNEKVLVVGQDVPYPMDISVDEKDKVGSDRITAAAAAYAVVESAVVVADLGTAVTIDLVDDRGVFCGGCILPGFEISAKALSESTAQLPKVTVKKPSLPFGKNTEDAINCGLYYSVVGALEEIIRRYAEKVGTWPKTIITGSGAAIVKDDCQFIDSYVPNMVVKGIALAYTKYIENRM